MCSDVLSAFSTFKTKTLEYLRRVGDLRTRKESKGSNAVDVRESLSYYTPHEAFKRDRIRKHFHWIWNLVVDSRRRDLEFCRLDNTLYARYSGDTSSTVRLWADQKREKTACRLKYGFWPDMVCLEGKTVWTTRSKSHGVMTESKVNRTSFFVKSQV